MALILFDYDGVLADTLHDLLQVGQQACDQLGVKHIVKEDDIRNLEVMSFASYGRACGVPEQHVDAFVQICLGRFADKKSPPPIFDGMRDVVRHLAADHTIVIVTTNSAHNVHAFLAEHGLDACVRAVYGVDMPGSKGQKIAIARERFAAGSQRESVFMVGDALSDMRAAKEAAITGVAVAWGHQSVERLMQGEPDVVVQHPYDLIEIIV